MFILAQAFNSQNCPVVDSFVFNRLWHVSFSQWDRAGWKPAAGRISETISLRQLVPQQGYVDKKKCYQMKTLFTNVKNNI